MRTLSVREVATALGLTKRAVMYRLENGKLKGTRVTNSYGQEEWRVYPNKEIVQAVEGKKGVQTEPILDFSVESEAIEAESVGIADENEPREDLGSWRAREIDRLELIAEKLMKPLAEKLEAQGMALKEKDLIIEEQSRRLRLLPDLEHKARLAEEDRRAAELKALETIALQKQVAELRLEAEKEKQTALEVEALRQQIVAIEQEKEKKEEEAREALRVAEELKLQSGELEQKLAAEAEEKQKVDEQLQAMKNQLEALTAKVERSWWKKFFGVE